ncbi:hypothetical protein VZT92_021741 [Zoarces viviparus]
MRMNAHTLVALVPKSLSLALTHHRKVRMGTQTATGRHTGTKPTSHFNKDYTGQFSGVAGYDFLQGKDPQCTFQPQDLRVLEPESCRPDSAARWERLDVQNSAACCTYVVCATIPSGLILD